MTLEELGNKLIAAEKVVAIDIEDPKVVPPPVRAAWLTKIEEAKHEIIALKAQYKGTLLRNGVAIFVDGDSDKAFLFANLVRTNKEGIVVDASALYNRLAQEVEPTLVDSTNRQWGTTQTQRLHSALMEVMSELNLDSIDMPAREQPVVPTFAAVVKHIRHLLSTINGDEMNKLYVEKLAAQDALQIRYMGTVAPTLILNASEGERKVLASGFAKGSAEVKVSAEDSIDEAFLIKTFKQVNKSIRKK